MGAELQLGGGFQNTTDENGGENNNENDNDNTNDQLPPLVIGGAARDPRIGKMVALLPLAFMLSFVIYVLMTQKKGENDDENNDPAQDLERRLPPNSSASTTAQLSM